MAMMGDHGGLPLILNAMREEMRECFGNALELSLR